MRSQAVPNKTTMIRLQTILNFVMPAFVLSFALKTNNEPLIKRVNSLEAPHRHQSMPFFT